jgi:hypothetical protein
MSVFAIHRHRGETSYHVQRIKQESSLMGGGSLACLLHHLSPEFSITLKSRRLISGTSQREEQGFHIRYRVDEPEMASFSVSPAGEKLEMDSWWTINLG